MQIKNDYKALEKAIKTWEEQLANLKKSSASLQKDMEQLHSKGWQDKNYTNLKNVITQQQTNLQQTMQGIEQMILELQNRTKILKSYYAINF
jgi:predicted  nucleic acid-binding Zn-ribbon protein